MSGSLINPDYLRYTSGSVIRLDPITVAQCYQKVPKLTKNIQKTANCKIIKNRKNQNSYVTFLFVYLNNAVRKFRYFVTIISQFVFYMMLQLSLKLSPSEKTYNRKNSNFLFFEKDTKTKKYLRFGSRQPITNFRGFSISNIFQRIS